MNSPQSAPVRRGVARWSVFSYGFRPFFLGCGVFGAIAIPAWLALHATQQTPWPGIPAQLWHAHEMLFGFAAAAIAGFLLTAVPSWTGIRGFAGAPLVAVWSLWCTARVLLAFAPHWAWPLSSLVELAFLPALAALIAPPIIRERNRNMAMLGVLAALWVADAVFLFAIGRQDVVGASRALLVTLDVVLLLVTIIGGRIVPSFTANALRRSGRSVELRRHEFVERLLPLTMIGNALADALVPGSGLVAAIASIAAILHLVRQSGWRSLDTRGEPILWVLHLAYAWLPIAFALKAGAAMAQLLGADFALGQFWQHAFGIGAVATMILAVMTRASLGHTGRPLQVAPAIAIAYALLALAGVARVVLPQLGVLDYDASLLVAGALWSSAFAIFAVHYAPILMGPRLDGKPG